MSRLHWIGQGMKPESFALEGPSVAVGRREDNDLVLSFGYISGHHARFFQRDGHWYVEDLGSTNGTRVNGNEPAGNPLREGDRIQLGSLDLQFGEEPPGGPRPASRAPTEIAGEGGGADAAPATDAFATLANLAPVQGTELEKLSLLLDLQVQWAEGFTGEETIQRILQSALTVSGAERACLLLQAAAGFTYSAGRDARGNALTEESFQASRSVLQEVVRRGEPVFMTQGLEGSLAEQKSVVAMNLRAVGCLPLRRRDRRSDKLLGILYLDSRAAMHTLSGLDEKILLKLAGEAESVLERVELIRVRGERQRLERELELAKETQESLLPDRIPDFAGWELEAFCRPTRHVGGDFYDFIRLGDGRLATVLADVSGKGVAASLLSSSVQGALQMMLREGHTLAEAFARVNEYLCERTREGRFVTVFAALLAPDGGLYWANAGHNPAYLFRAATGEIEELGATGIILGSLSAEEFGITHGEREHRLEAGDLLMVYSDGLTEATGPRDELFGEERLRKLLAQGASGGAAKLRPRVLDAVEAFTRGEEQSDDITLVLAQRVG